MAASLLLQRPFWQITNSLVLPVLSDDNGDGVPTIRSLVSFSIPVAIFLDTLFGESASTGNMAADQLNVFRSMEDSIGAMGIDGRGCLLRLICELQSNPIGEFTVIGEIITVLFTPKRGLNDFLDEYIHAEMAGANGEHCATRYPTCPFSIMNTLRQHKKFMEGFSTIDDRPALGNPPYAEYDFGNNHVRLPEVVYH
ncbi:uncharacterized protein [Palaemon carinicauda]|uniref:uncharacterized protein isoform X2 n=1 Tax=Palaemon carinicauda TaxID=392227 RepID=UPI0035B57B09